LEPVESKYVINSERIQNSNSDKLNSWINSNYKKINKKEEKLDDVYESILLSAFMLLVLFYTAVVGYSASFQLFLIYLGMALIFYWPFRWRDSGKLFAEDLQPNERVDKIKVYSTFAISFVLVSAGLIIDVIA